MPVGILSKVAMDLLSRRLATVAKVLKRDRLRWFGHAERMAKDD